MNINNGSGNPAGVPGSTAGVPAAAPQTTAVVKENGPSNVSENATVPDEEESPVREEATSTMPLTDLAMQLEDYTPTIPDTVTSYYMNKAGLDCTDVRMIRLISLAGQKFISDVATDALQNHRMRMSTASSRKQGKDRKHTLLMDDLTPVLQEAGINVKKPPYFA